jgi:hypothetical protein
MTRARWWLCQICCGCTMAPSRPDRRALCTQVHWRDEIGRAFSGSSALHGLGDSYLLLARPSARLGAVELRFQFRYAALLAPQLHRACKTRPLIPSATGRR